MNISRNIGRRELLTTIVAGITGAVLTSQSNGEHEQKFPDIPLRIADDKYESKLLAFNLRNPGNLSLNSRGNLYFVNRIDSYEEGVSELSGENIIDRFPPSLKLGQSAIRTKIESSKKGEVFIYQANGLEDCLRVFGENGKKILELRDYFLKGDRTLMYPVKDFAVNPTDGRFYVPLEGRIEVFDPHKPVNKGALEEWVSNFRETTQAVCFDSKGNLYVINRFMIDLFGEKEKFSVVTVDNNKDVSKLELKSPLAILDGKTFAFYDIKFDPTDRNLIISGQLITDNRSYDCLFKSDILTRDTRLIAVASQGYSISGIDIGRTGNMYISLSKGTIILDNLGMIVALRKK